MTYFDTDIVAINKINSKDDNESDRTIIAEYSAVKLFIEDKYLRYATIKERQDRDNLPPTEIPEMLI